MDTLYFKVPRLKEESVRIESWDLPHFFDPVHLHEDCQVTLILDGEGYVIANGSISTFSKGNIFAFGKNVPHVLRNNESYYESESSLKAKAISVFFNEDIFLNLFELVPEWRKLKLLIENMNTGLKIKKKDAKNIKAQIELLESKNGVEKITCFIDILYNISNLENVISLSGSMIKSGNTDSNIKLNKVYEHLLNNYMHPIKLNEVASLIHMSPNAFCRFFKNRTNKTFSGVLIEIRIKKVCKMLAEGNCNITEAYLANGYNNSSNFHRHFRMITGMTPIEYKSTIKEKK